jgi:lipopolysaccharide transport system ATP-binding protein
MGYLHIHNIGKAYKRYPKKWGRIAEWIGMEAQHDLRWILRGISFDVEPGESVGIIGINGAGKSTLLKIIVGTTRPTYGSVKAGGRISALLELGMGFLPEFTGRQNVYMAGQLRAMDADEVTRLMPEIEAFAEIGDYIDQQVRIYSSGMQVRLAFAVATAVRPDILIVDEALSVGDASFQRKCFSRIESYLSAGTTLLFVSHDTETIKKLCSKALFIRDGLIGLYGTAKLVCNEYEKYLFGGTSERQSDLSHEPQSSHFDSCLVPKCEQIYGDGRAVIESCWIEDLLSNKVNVIESGKPFRWCYRVRFITDIEEPIFAMMLKTRESIAIYGTDTKKLNFPIRAHVSNTEVEVAFELCNNLAPGIYYLNCGVRMDFSDGIVFLSRRMDAAILRIISQDRTTVASGILDMKARLSLVYE